MANAGNSLEEMIALMTAGTEITRDASKVATGLKSITLNLQGMTEEGEEDLELMSTMENLFDKLGLSVYDSNGELKNTYNLLSDLASVYDGLTASEKSYVTQTIAGKYQAQNLSAILSNWATAEEALTAAQNSSGSAMKENNKVMESVQGHLSKLRSEWEKLSTSLLSSDMINAVLSLSTAFLKLANTGVGTLIIKAGLLSGTLALVSTALTTISEKMIHMASKTIVSSLEIEEQRAELTKYYIELMLTSGAVDGLTEAEIKNAATKKVLALSDEQVTAELISQYAATMKLNQGLKVLLKNGLANLTSFFVSIPGKITIVITAIYAIYKAIKWVAEYSEKKLEKANEALSETKDKIEELNNELEENKNRIKEIQDLGDLASLTDEKELQELTEKNKLLEQQLNYYKKIKEEQEETAKKTSAQVLNKYLEYSDRTVTLSGEPKTATGNTSYFNKSSGFSTGDIQTGLQRSVEDTRVISSLQDEIDLYNELNAIENRTESQEDALKASKEALEAQMEKYKKGLENENLTEEDRLKLLEQYNKVLQVIDPTQYKIDMLNTILEQDTDAVKEFNAALKQLASKGMNITEEEFNELFGDDAFGGIYEQLEEAGLGLDDVIANFVELDDTIESNMTTLDSYLTSLKSIDETWSGLNSVIEEFNNYGGLSADTIQKILENDWGEYLQFANGELTLNNGLLAQNAEQVKQKALALLDEREQEELLTLAQKAVAENEKNEVKNSSTVLSAKQSIVKATLAVAWAYLKEALGIKAVKDAEEGKDIDLTTFDWASSGYEDEYNEIVTKYANERALVNAYSYNVGASSGTSSSSSGTSSSSSGASSSSKEWWEERLDDLKEQFNYNKLTIQEYINELNTLLGQVSEGTDAWDEINEELQKQRLSQVEDAYDRGTISAKEYVAQLKELIKAYKEGTEAWLDLADKIKSGLQEIAETQKDDLETAADAAMNIIDEEIERLESLREAEEERYDKLIEEKEKANDETEKEIELARLQEALENAKREKTKRVKYMLSIKIAQNGETPEEDNTVGKICFEI